MNHYFRNLLSNFSRLSNLSLVLLFKVSILKEKACDSFLKKTKQLFIVVKLLYSIKFKFKVL